MLRDLGSTFMNGWTGSNESVVGFVALLLQVRHPIPYMVRKHDQKRRETVSWSSIRSNQFSCCQGQVVQWRQHHTLVGLEGGPLAWAQVHSEKLLGNAVKLNDAELTRLPLLFEGLVPPGR